MKLLIDLFSGTPWYPAGPVFLSWEVGNALGALNSAGGEAALVDVLQLRGRRPADRLRGDMAVVVAGDRNGTRNPDFRPGSPENMEKLAMAFNGFTLLCGEAARNPSEAEKRAWDAYNAVCRGDCASCILDLLSGSEPVSRRLREEELVELRRALRGPPRAPTAEIRVDSGYSLGAMKEVIRIMMGRGFKLFFLTRKRGGFRKIEELSRSFPGIAFADYLETWELERCPSCALPPFTLLKVREGEEDDAAGMLRSMGVRMGMLYLSRHPPTGLDPGPFSYLVMWDPEDQRRAHSNFISWCREGSRTLISRAFPVGELLDNVYVLSRRGTYSAGYTAYNIPLSVHVKPPVEEGQTVRVRVTGHAPWTVKGLRNPLDANTAPFSALLEIPGLRRREAIEIVKRRPFSTEGELWELLGREMRDWLTVYAGP